MQNLLQHLAYQRVSKACWLVHGKILLWLSLFWLFFKITQHTSLGGPKSKHVASAASPEGVRRLEGSQQPHSLMQAFLLISRFQNNISHSKTSSAG